MFEFLGLNRNKTDKASATAEAATEPFAEPLSATQREMVRLTLHNVLKRHGIPAQWIAADLTPVMIPSQGQALLLQMTVMKWHDALMLYAPALQHELLESIKRFESGADHGKYLFAWKFAPDCGYPYTGLPKPEFWSAAPSLAAKPTSASAAIPLVAAAMAVSVGAVAAPIVKPKFDLPKTAADEEDDSASGFAATQIGDI